MKLQSNKAQQRKQLLTGTKTEWKIKEFEKKKESADDVQELVAGETAAAQVPSS